MIENLLDRQAHRFTIQQRFKVQICLLVILGFIWILDQVIRNPL